MKVVFGATVVGNEIYRPDPKMMPLTWAGRVKLEVEARASGVDKPTKALIVMDVDQMKSEFKLGSKFRITLEDSQQELELGRASTETATREPEASPAPARGRGRRGGPRGIVSVAGPKND